MAEENRGQPHEPDRPGRGPDAFGQSGSRSQGGTDVPRHSSGQPQHGLARTGQGASRPQSGLARTGQGAGRSQSGLARSGQSASRSRSGSARSRQRSIPPPPGLDPALRESIRSQQEEEQRRQSSDRPPNGPERRPRRRKSARRQRGTMARVAGALLYVLLVIVASAVLATVGWVWACDLLGLNKEYASIEITITDDTQLDSIVDILEEKGLIEYKFLFKLYTRFSHAEDKIAPGTYELNTEMDYHAHNHLYSSGLYGDGLA